MHGQMRNNFTHKREREGKSKLIFRRKWELAHIFHIFFPISRFLGEIFFCWKSLDIWRSEVGRSDIVNLF